MLPMIASVSPTTGSPMFPGGIDGSVAVVVMMAKGLRDWTRFSVLGTRFSELLLLCRPFNGVRPVGDLPSDQWGQTPLRPPRGSLTVPLHAVPRHRAPNYRLPSTVHCKQTAEE
jgi:hypothetical protein